MNLGSIEPIDTTNEPKRAPRILGTGPARQYYPDGPDTIVHYPVYGGAVAQEATAPVAGSRLAVAHDLYHAALLEVQKAQEALAKANAVAEEAERGWYEAQGQASYTLQQMDTRSNWQLSFNSVAESE
jgi:hypothetical protein